ncbi:hypothetical protein ACWGE1_15125 [Streptomyces sp. NPDC054932]
MARTGIRRVVLFTAVATLALAALVVVAVSSGRGASATIEKPPNTHSATATKRPAAEERGGILGEGGGSGQRLWSVFKHLWTSTGMAKASPEETPSPPDTGRTAAVALSRTAS